MNTDLTKSAASLSEEARKDAEEMLAEGVETIIRHPGDGWVTGADGNKYWGIYGSAGMLIHNPETNTVLLQHRSPTSHHGGTWGAPGGARMPAESALTAAQRETEEEAHIKPADTTPLYAHVIDRGGWSYTTIIASTTQQLETDITDGESVEFKWIPVDQLSSYPLHPGFAGSLPELLPYLGCREHIVVDVANVMGSVPGGWWKNRREAATRLIDRVADIAATPEGVRAGFTEVPDRNANNIRRAFPHWHCVVEGQARGINPPPHANLSVHSAEQVGDDEILRIVRDLRQSGEHVCVVTGDAELRLRVKALGANVRGPKKMLKLLQKFEAEAEQGEATTQTETPLSTETDS